MRGLLSIIGAIGAMLYSASDVLALSSTDVSVRLISGYVWMDNACTNGGPQGKVLAFRIKNLKGSDIYALEADLSAVTFSSGGSVTYSSGTPSFSCQTSSSVFLGDLPAGDSATVFYYIGYNCLIYPNNSAITTDMVNFPITLSDNQSGTVSQTHSRPVYVIRNSSNNTINVNVTGSNLVGTITKVTVSYTISNVKLGSIIDMELSVYNTFPSGYDIVGCKIVSSNVTNDFPVNMENTFYTNNSLSNLPTGGTIEVEWYLKVTSSSTGVNSSNILPYLVADAGGAHRWQTIPGTYTGTAVPVNTMKIKKRVNFQNVLTNDTVIYTIVLSNSSTQFDITIDRILDNLPRDYQFKYIETNTGIFPRLVTYNNSTVVPVYRDTNLLLFRGTKLLGSGIYSWVIPKSDSIKLIYSSKVSSNPGMRDTNFVTAYVGNHKAGTAFAIVNVFSFLPMDLLYFRSARNSAGVELVWELNNPESGSHFILERYDPLKDEYIHVSRIEVDGNTNKFHAADRYAGIGSVKYRLLLYTASGQSEEYFAELDPSTGEFPVKFVLREQQIDVYTDVPDGKPLSVQIYDINGRLLSTYSGTSEQGKLEIPYNKSELNGLILVRVNSASGPNTIRLIIE